MTSPSPALPLPAVPAGRTSAFRPALRYEWIAIRSLRAPWLLCGLALAAQILIDVLIGREAASGNQQFGKGMQGVTLIGFAFFAALGVSILGSEYRHRTITRTVLTLRDRWIILAAKAVVTAIVTAAAAVVMAGVNALTVPVLGGASLSLPWAAAVGAAGVLYAVLCALMGLALAGLTRNQVLPVAVVFLWPLLLENLVISFTRISPNLAPFAAAAAQAQSFDGATPRWVLMLPLAVLTAAALGGAGVVFRRRDV